MTIKDYFSKNFKFHKKFYICAYNSFNSTEKKLFFCIYIFMTKGKDIDMMSNSEIKLLMRDLENEFYSIQHNIKNEAFDV